MRTHIAFLAGGIAAFLIAATAFRGGQPLDSTFTYQGQLRNAGQLVNGSADLRFTLWDSDTAGAQVGTANTFNNYTLTDGRFAIGLNFGAGAFNGDERWIQVEFRSPAGSGQYMTLSPRDKINATPYALYALNGSDSHWTYNPKAQGLSTSVSKVGIGTSSPTAALEVVGSGGDDAVKLPMGSIGASEVSAEFAAAGYLSGGLSASGGTTSFDTPRTFVVANSGFLVLDITTKLCPGPGFLSLFIDDVGVGGDSGVCADHRAQTIVPISAGAHTFRAQLSAPTSYPTGATYGVLVYFVRDALVFQ